MGDVDRTRNFHCTTIAKSRKVHQVQLVMCVDIQLCWCIETYFVFMLSVKILQHLSHVNKYMFLLSLMCLIMECIQVSKYVDYAKFVECKQATSSHGN